MNDAGIQRLPPQAAPRAQTLNAGTDPTIIGDPRDTLRLDQEADVDAAAKAADAHVLMVSNQHVGKIVLTW